MAIRIAIMVFICLTYARMSVANVQFVDVNRKVDDIAMTVSFVMPKNAQTQAIRCPGILMKLRVLNQLHGNIGLRDNKNRLGIIQQSTGMLEFSDAVKTHFRQDPKSEFYVFKGSPGTWLALECGPYSNAGNPEETYTEQYFESYREAINSPTACYQSRREGNKIFFTCGYGFLQPYGCRLFQEERRKICYDIKNGQLEKWDLVTPGILEHYKTVVGSYADDARMKEFVDRANTAAAQGDPFFEVSADAARAAAEAEAQASAYAQQQAESAARAQEIAEQARFTPASPTYHRTAPQSSMESSVPFNFSLSMWVMGVIASTGVVLRYNGIF